MSITVCVATYGDPEWQTLAWNRAVPSVRAQDGHVRTNHLGDGTIAETRNLAAATAEGDWLCFLDADDEIAPGFLGAMGRALEQQGTGGGRLLLTPAVQQIRNGPPSRPFFYPSCSLTTGNWLVIGTLISRELFWEIGGFREHPHGLEDWNLWARAVRAGAQIVKVPDAIYIAYMNPQSKHHRLSRNRQAYREAYAHAKADAWG